MPRNDQSGDVLNYSAATATPLGHYRIANGFILAPGIASGTICVAMRWGDASRLMVLEKFKWTFIQTVPAGVTTVVGLGFVICRAFTASDTGGTAMAPLGANSAKMRTSMGTSLVTDLRQTTGPSLGIGVRTPDPVFAAIEPFFVSVAWPAPGDGPVTALYEARDDKHPHVFAQNEGFELVTNGGMPAAGQGAVYWEMEWAEVDAY